MPDRGFILSANRTAHPLSVKFATVIASSALALGAAAAAATSSAPARPTALPAPAHRAAGRLTTTHAQPGVRLATLFTPAAATAAKALTPRQIARQMLGSFGWSQGQFPYLNWLWNRRKRLEQVRAEPVLGRVRHPAGPAGRQDGHRGPELAQQREDPDPLGPAVHPRHLRQPAPGLGPRGRVRLVLRRVPEHDPVPGRPVWRPGGPDCRRPGSDLPTAGHRTARRAAA